MTPHRTPPAARRRLALAALLALTTTACVPVIPTPTPAAPVGKPPPVSDKVLQSPNLPSPPPGNIPGATPAGSFGYPGPGPTATPESRAAPTAKAYP